MTEKQEIRERIWEILERQGVARFPGTRGRIPNHEGAVDCARRLDEVPVWSTARVVKCNPDFAQLPVRARAFHEGKILCVAVPRLRKANCFLQLDPEKIDVNPWRAVSIKGIHKYGRPVSPDRMRQVDLVLCGSVAVSRAGARVGKGGGYSDLEYALGRSYGFVEEKTPTLTTVHPLQVVEDRFELAPHDFPVDWIVTPEESIDTRTTLPRPHGILWDLLDEEQMKAMPVLARLRARQGKGQGLGIY